MVAGGEGGLQVARKNRIAAALPAGLVATSLAALAEGGLAQNVALDALIGTHSVQAQPIFYSRSAQRLYDGFRHSRKGLYLQTGRLHQDQWQFRALECQGTAWHHPQGGFARSRSTDDELYSKSACFRLFCIRQQDDKRQCSIY